MMKFVDSFLNRITMYRLVLYYLVGLVGIAAILSYFKILSYNPAYIIFEAIALSAFCWIFNTISANFFGVPENNESSYITALILALIISPANPGDMHYLLFLVWAAIIAMSSKYILSLNKKHIFNPAALAVAITSFAIGQSATWWVGTAVMVPFVLVGGLLIVQKIKRFDLVISFFITAIIVTLSFDLSAGVSIISSLQGILLNSSLFFFAFVMLTEPLTTPPTKTPRIIYGAITGLLFAPQVHLLSIYSTPELALLSGNIFSYLVSPKKKLLLTLKERIQMTPTVYDFIFDTGNTMKFTPGQYLEWTIGHDKVDSRGNRRYFTIASSPTENHIAMGIKFYEPASSFKQALLKMQPGDKLLAGQLAGDFLMPKNKNDKLVFIAGGIGVTPFRSMLKYLVDKNEKRDIVVFYSNKTSDEFAYIDVFRDAGEKLGIRSVFTITDQKTPDENWHGEIGQITPEMLKKYVPDYDQRTFYISGPHSMVSGFSETLNNIGVHQNKIITDYFPGFV